MTVKIGIDYDEPMFTWYDYAHKVSVDAGIVPEGCPPPTRWDPHSEYGCTQQAWYDALNAEIVKGHEGMYGWPLRKDAVEAVRKAYGMGYEIHFITARGSFGHLGEQIKRLTRRQLIWENVPSDGLWFHKDKGEIIKRLDIDYMLDDRWDNWLDAKNAGAESYLLNERWNQGPDYPVAPEFRVDSVVEYIDLIIAKHGIIAPHKVLSQRTRGEETILL